jgi:hypothetical protein
MNNEMDDKEFLELIEKIIKDYSGNAQLLSAALGALVLARYVGLKPVRLVHRESTIRKYQSALGVHFKDVVPEKGRYAYKSVALAIVERINKYWDVVQGRDTVVVTKDEKYLFDM